MTPLQRHILDMIQDGFPLTPDPYAVLADSLDCATDTVHTAVMELRREGIIRRIGGSFVASALGYRSTLAAARVEATHLEEAASRASAWPEVTHNYERSAEYNLWFTIIAQNDRRLREILDDMRHCSGVESVIALPAVRMFKLRATFQLGVRETDTSAHVGTPPFVSHASQAGAWRSRERADDSRCGCATPIRRPMDAIDRLIIPRLSGDIGEDRHPFHESARAMGLDEAIVLERLHDYLDRGMMRRFGAILRHQRAGFRANGMCVWNLPHRQVEPAAATLCARNEVTHCYERVRAADWPYNFYAMIHGHTEQEVRDIAETVAVDPDTPPYRLMFSLREFKKTSLVIA